MLHEIHQELLQKHLVARIIKRPHDSSPDGSSAGLAPPRKFWVCHDLEMEHHHKTFHEVLTCCENLLGTFALIELPTNCDSGDTLHQPLCHSGTLKHTTSVCTHRRPARKPTLTPKSLTNGCVGPRVESFKISQAPHEHPRNRTWISMDITDITCIIRYSSRPLICWGVRYGAFFERSISYVQSCPILKHAPQTPSNWESTYVSHTTRKRNAPFRITTIIHILQLNPHTWTWRETYACRENAGDFLGNQKGRWLTMMNYSDSLEILRMTHKYMCMIVYV